MKEIYGDAWELSKNFDILCITTNGTIKKNGECVMGRGIAAQAKDRMPGIALTLGGFIRISGNHVNVFAWPSNDIKYGIASPLLCSFPVKHNWWEKADLELIKQSCRELNKIITKLPSTYTVLLPRPGCGNGQLSWENVKKEIEPLLNDQVYIVHFKE